MKHWVDHIRSTEYIAYEARRKYGREYGREYGRAFGRSLIGSLVLVYEGQSEYVHITI